MLTLTLLLLQAAAPQRSVDDAVAAFAKGDEAPREELLKAGVTAILALRKVRGQSAERIDPLIFEIKCRTEDPPAKDLIHALKGPMSIETGDVKCGLVLAELCDNNLPLLLDPALFQTHWDKPMNLSLKDRPRREVLETFCRKAKLDYGFFYGVVLISEPERLWPAPPPVFREVSLTLEESDRAAKLIEQLANDDFQAREAAQAALKKLGKAVIPLLEKGAQGEDTERNARCHALIRTLTEPPPQALFHRPAAAQQKLAGADADLRDSLHTQNISFKVQDIVLDGAMRLMLQPRQIPFQLSPALLRVRLTLDAQNTTAWAILGLATHYCGCDFMIENGKLVIDTREEIQKRLAGK